MCITVYHCESLCITESLSGIKASPPPSSLCFKIITQPLMDWQNQAALFRLLTNLTKESPMKMMMMMGGQRRGGVIEGCLIIFYVMMMIMTIGRAQRWHDPDKGRISDINICQNGLAHTICSSTFPI